MTERDGKPVPDTIRPSLTITEPVEMSQVAIGTSVTVRGTAFDEGGVGEIVWSLDGGNYTRAARNESAWSASVPISTRGGHTVRIRCTDHSGNVAEATRTVVGFDSSPPELVVNHPTVEAGTSEAKVTDTVMRLFAQALDSDATSGVKVVKWSLDGGNFKDAARSGNIGGGWSLWTADISIPPRVVKDGTPYTLTVRAYNLDDRYSERQVRVRAVDVTRPKLEITNPPPDVREILGTASGATFQLRGTASDTHDELHSGLDRVECTLDGKSIPVIPQAAGDWSTWSADVQIPAHDEHNIAVRCYDKQGNLALLKRCFVAALRFKVKDLSSRSYLQDLLDFATLRVKQEADGTDVDPVLFANAYHQPFAGLVAPTGDAPNQRMHQIRLCTEVLRDYLAPRPTAHWGFDEGGGSVVLDSSGNGNTGTLQGATRFVGRGGRALEFDGVDDYVQMGDTPNLVMTNAATISARIFPKGTGTSGIGGIIVNREDEYEVARFPDGTIQWAFANSSPGWQWINTGFVAPINRWTHVAVVYDKGNVKTYANGRLVHTYAEGAGPIGDYHPMRNDFRIGGRQYEPQHFQGLIDEVKIYDRALSAPETQNLFSPARAGEVAWVEDAVPAGATLHGDEGWNWVGANPAPFSGTLAHQSNVAAGIHQHYFQGATATLAVNRGDRLFAYVYLDPTNLPEEVMLVWNDGTWQHRAYWGANKIEVGTDGTDSRRRIGDLPKEAGEWVRLEVPASLVGLEGGVLSGMTFRLYGGRATWDRAGKTGYTGYSAALAEAEAGYRRAAYQALLGGLGTSYEEIRLARVADKATREALAERLGIELGPAQPDRLDRLFLRLEHVTEADLERIFGLAATTRSPLESAVTSEPELLSWRLERLRTLWKRQDRPTGAEVPPPIIDPDLISRDDLQNPSRDDPAFDLWDFRRNEVDKWMNEFRRSSTRRGGESTPLESFDHVVGEVLGPLDLPDLDRKRKNGIKIEVIKARVKIEITIEDYLKEKQLSLAAFDYLVRVRNLADAGSVLASEWEDVYSILAQVRKLRSYKGWREQERLKDLTLGPDHFKVPKETAPPIKLPAWRATERARRTWQNTLRARIDQQQSVAQALRTTVDAAEEATLPLLRDALVTAIGAGRTDIDVAEALTRRLLIDVESSGYPKTTRIDQAVETLQSILFSLRAGHFEERTAELDSNPAAGWRLDQRDQYKEEHFDQELKWMGSHDTWRAAMFAFLYPENLLLPSLREDPTPGSEEKDPTDAFKTLVSNLRKRRGLAPEQARDEAKTYLKDLKKDASVIKLKDELEKNPPGWNKPFELTEQLDEAQLLARRDWVARLYNLPDLSSAQAKTYLKEVFYFVPLQLALQLQQSGEYLAALDWFQTVYAYNLPAGKRKIYDPLKLDATEPQPVNRTVEWLLNSLNPHRVAVTRANAYTRFTLLSLARCFLEYADAEFTRDTDGSLPRARALYMNVLDLLDSPEMEHAAVGATPDPDTFPPNPVPQSLRRRAELNLSKLRTGRNFAGMQRQIEPVVQDAEATNGLPTIGSDGRIVVPGTVTLRPTPYYYSVLIERAKQLVAISQQVEAAYLSALERTDAENYGLLEAGHALDLSKATVDLQKLRQKEAEDGQELANRQKSRAQVEASTYNEWIQAGPNQYEESMLDDYREANKWRNWTSHMDAALTVAQAIETASSGGLFGTGVGGHWSGVAVIGALAIQRDRYTTAMNNAELSAQVNAFYASHERSKDQWTLQKSIAEKDIWIGDQQIQLAKDHLEVAKKEHGIAQTQSDQAKAVADFLANKFTNAELYEWMSGVLGQVYAYFLRQSTAVAQLAQSQLAFERQETPPSFIQTDYWQPPSDTGANGAGEDEAPDRRGLTGSARLLQDIYQLDQYAFETNRRKLHLTQTISLAQSAPFEFQRFRETGELPFATPMELFDRAFPGHYLRLIRRVRTSVVALVPPTQGIKATLSASGVSRVVTGGDVFQNVVVRRNPELVALSSPNNATGLFELDPQSDMLLPFEGMGVDTSWEFEMPKAANPFDYRTIADVLIAIEYTALNSFDYHKQVIQGLDYAVSADRPFSLREQFPDQWYDLHNPGGTATPMTISFTTTRDDFPPNVEELKIQHLVLFFVRADGVTSEMRVRYLHLKQGTSRIEAGEAISIDGVISTRNGNVGSWASMTGAEPIGEWELALPDDEQTKNMFKNGEIEDILFIVTYSGETPEWPA